MQEIFSGQILTLYDVAAGREICNLPWSDAPDAAMDYGSRATMSADGQRIGLHLVVHGLQSLRENRIAILDVKEKRPVFIYSQPLEGRGR